MTNIGETNQTGYGSTSTSTVTAFFENHGDADKAIEKLADAGIGRENIRLVAGKEQNARTGEPEHKGFWATLEDMFFPDDDRAVYSEGLRRGGYLLTVSNLTDDKHDVAVDILDDEGSIDLDERSAAWKSEGWSPSAAGNGYVARTAAPQATATSTAGVGTDEVIPVVEEQLRVGKRDVNNGRVRVRAYTVETPVSEQVSLRDENVTIERRPVDRIVSGTEATFQNRTIVAEEHHEEAVIAKDAHVVEEISLRKTSEQRDETVSDSVRKTEVEIEDERGNKTLTDGSFGKRPV